LCGEDIINEAVELASNPKKICPTAEIDLRFWLVHRSVAMTSDPYHHRYST
jgi:hypothetical protein